jgi:ABC-type uncharacterized transport system permease subunit
MSTTVTAPPAPAPQRALTSRFQLTGWRRAAAIGSSVFALLSLARILADAPDLTSGNTFGAGLRLAVPILCVGLGALYAERAGIVNIGLEGMMATGTFFAGWLGWQYGPWWGVVGGVLGGALLALVHAVATVTFGVDHVVSGVAINLLGPGMARYLAAQVFDGKEGSSATLGPTISGDVGQFTMPLTSGGDLFGWQTPNPLRWIERKEWFLVSDVAGLLRGLTTNVSWIVVIAVALVPITAYVLWRTPFGLRLRSCGEKPSAADSLGVNVYRTKYIAVVISGACAGLGASMLVLEGAGRFQDGQTAGRGFIGIAAMVFGNWRPSGVLAGAGLFGFAEGLAARSNDSVKALVFSVAVAAAVVAVVMLVRRSRPLPSVALMVFAALLFAYYATVDDVPDSFVAATPYITTLLVLAFASKQLRPPAADGMVWRKGQQS